MVKVECNWNVIANIEIKTVKKFPGLLSGNSWKQIFVYYLQNIPIPKICEPEHLITKSKDFAEISKKSYDYRSMLPISSRVY